MFAFNFNLHRYTEVKHVELQTAEHELQVAERLAKRKAARERHVFHLSDSSVVDDGQTRSNGGSDTKVYKALETKVGRCRLSR